MCLRGCLWRFGGVVAGVLGKCGACGVCSRLLEMADFSVRKQVRTAAQNQTDLTFYACWLWRGIYHLTRFAERQKERHDDILAFCNRLSDPNSGLIEHLHIVARWAELYTRSSKEG